MYYWVVYRKDNSVVTSPCFESAGAAEQWANSTPEVPDKRVITTTNTRRHPVKMSDILKNKVDI